MTYYIVLTSHANSSPLRPMRLCFLMSVALRQGLSVPFACTKGIRSFLYSPMIKTRQEPFVQLDPPCSSGRNRRGFRTSRCHVGTTLPPSASISQIWMFPLQRGPRLRERRQQHMETSTVLTCSECVSSKGGVRPNGTQARRYARHA
jgi:hypothetical protein